MPVIEDEALKAKANEIIQRDGFILYPDVLPEGYCIDNIIIGNANKILFKNNLNSKIAMIYYPNLNMGLYNDSDSSDNVEILVNGQSAIYHESNEKNEIYWNYEKLKIQLISFDKSITATDLISIAEGVKKYYNIF